MHKLFIAALSLLLTTNLWAADNTVIVTPGTGVTIRSKDVGAGVESMMQILGDTSGNALATAPGTPNGSFALPIQGVTGGTAVPISGTVSGTGTFTISGAVTNAGTFAVQLTGATNNINNIAGTITLPTGAATAANQATEISSLSTIATNTGAAIPAGTAVIGKVGIDQTTPGTTNGVQIAAAIPAGTNLIGYASADVCTQKAKTNLAISQNGTSSVQLIALSGSTVIYVCSLSLIAAGATTVAITTGTGTACVTGNAAVIGSTTANIANSMSLAANGGLTLGSGNGTVAAGAASSELCMILGTSVYVSGNLTYVQQ